MKKSAMQQMQANQRAGMQSSRDNSYHCTKYMQTRKSAQLKKIKAKGSKKLLRKFLFLFFKQ